MKKKILITGGAGFIGYNFIKICLKKNYQVVNIDPLKYSAIGIVKTIEKLISKEAQYDLINKGDLNWKIDVSQISKSIKNCKIDFNNDYLKNVLKKYFF